MMQVSGHTPEHEEQDSMLRTGVSSTGVIEGDRWCILRVAGARTLPLARSLSAAGFDAWTPTRTTRRTIGGKHPKVIEVDLAILPTFVFARAVHLPDLAAAAVLPVSPHPAFSIFRHAGRIPLVGYAQVAGLRGAEREAAEAMQDLRDAETQEGERKARIALLQTERARRKALRMERRDFPINAKVTVDDAPALAGMAGIVKQSDGTSALVAFGGSLVMKIEAWRLSPYEI